jgi:hypothetical protein
MTMRTTTKRAPLRPRALLALAVVTLTLLSFGPTGCDAAKKKKKKKNKSAGIKTESKPLPLHSPDQTDAETLELETPKVCTRRGEERSWWMGGERGCMHIHGRLRGAFLFRGWKNK